MQDLSNEEETLEMLMRVTEVLVDRPTDLLVEASVTDHGTMFKVTPHPDDLAKLIGVGGRMARALRLLLHSAGAKHRTRYTLDIMDSRKVFSKASDMPGALDGCAVRPLPGATFAGIVFVPKQFFEGGKTKEEALEAYMDSFDDDGDSTVDVLKHTK